MIILIFISLSVCQQICHNKNKLQKLQLITVNPYIIIVKAYANS
jgi:hypothetical protein